MVNTQARLSRRDGESECVTRHGQSEITSLGSFTHSTLWQHSGRGNKGGGGVDIAQRRD